MDTKGFEKKPWFPYLKNMYDDIEGDMMSVDAKGYEEKPWWPYVLNLQEKIEAGGGGGGMFKFTVSNMSSSVIKIPAMVQTDPTYEVKTVAGGNSANLELPVVDGIVKVRLTGAGTFAGLSKGCTYSKGLLTITEDDATAIFM